MTAGPAVDAALIDMMGAVFAGYREKHPPTTTIQRDPDLWRHLDELGLVRLTGDEQHGGSGAAWTEAAELLAAAVSHGIRIALAEHDLLACWLLDAAGYPQTTRFGPCACSTNRGWRHGCHGLGR